MSHNGTTASADDTLFLAATYLYQPIVLYAICVICILLPLAKLLAPKRLDLDRVPSPTLSEVLQLCRDVPRANEWFRRCHEKYGPIFRFRALHREIVMVADTAVASQILTTGPEYLQQKVPEYAALNPVSWLLKAGLQLCSVV